MVETSGGRWRLHLHGQRRSAAAFLAANKTLLAAVWVAGFALVFLWQSASVFVAGGGGGPRPAPAPSRPAPRLRPMAYNLTDFGGVGDGRAVNTRAFERAVETVSAFADQGGAQLNVPPGRWLTGPFNLTSHMTLFLAEGAEILGITDERDWPLMPALPSYGYGRERKGPRFGSLIHGQNLKDVVITGHNGSINGQGEVWWLKHRRRMLKNTRPPLVQLMWSKDIVITNITLRNSPFWHFHPYDCTNVTVSDVTILAPISGAPNTDGIDPDSCEDVLIENCYISVGDDAIAIKSGWDQYGIAYGRPSSNILIRNVTVRSLVSAGISIGSEMSGGVANVMVENVRIWDSRRGMRIKTAIGRGGYIRNISYSNITFDNVRAAIVIKVDYNEHADDGYDRNAFPDITGISFKKIHGWGVRVPVRAHGSNYIPIKDITFQDMSVGISYKKKHIFQCSYIEGRVIGSVFPKPCENLDVYDEQGQLLKSGAVLNSTEVDYDI
ncbi:probable polygalacturonase [Triticum urartu]|uniref:Polygalacturonase n=2 Tax=Triticum urartu TaxID=4572 RepID=A0A8R7V0F1_TRIUA|nr:probable polygalacturonase [Triticum urartu]